MNFYVQLNIYILFVTLIFNMFVGTLLLVMGLTWCLGSLSILQILAMCSLPSNMPLAVVGIKSHGLASRSFGGKPFSLLERWNRRHKLPCSSVFKYRQLTAQDV